jgi:hypothetical protein
MNYLRLALAALGGTVASFAFGFSMFWLVPGLIKEGHKYTDSLFDFPVIVLPDEEIGDLSDHLGLPVRPLRVAAERARSLP